MFKAIHPGSRRLKVLIELLALAAFVGLSAWGGITLTKETGRVAAMWLPNGAILALLMSSRQYSKRLSLLVGFVANVFGDMATGDSLVTASIMSLFNSFEVLLAVSLLSLVVGNDSNLSQVRIFSRFAFFGVLIAPLITSLLAATYLRYTTGADFYVSFLCWMLADSLGLAIVTPVCLELLNGSMLPLFSKDRLSSTLGGLLVSIVVVGAVFYQTRYPFLFFIPPVLGLVATREGLPNVALTMPFLAFMALLATTTGYGPFMLAKTSSPSEKIILCQVFILCNFVLLSSVANITSERRRALLKLSQLAMMDGLTGIANRRSFNEALTENWRRARSVKRPLSLILMDVDHFKFYNDSYGHISGDNCLSAVAQVLATFTYQSRHVVARYGGEEFAVILVDCDQDNARMTADQIRLSLIEKKIPHARNKSGNGIVTISMGLSTFLPEEIVDNHGPESLIQNADKALYEAKRTGRNKVVCLETVLTDIQPLSDQEEKKRLSILNSYMESVPKHSEELNNVAYLAATLLNAPIGLVSLVGRDEQVFVGRYGLDEKGTSRDVSFCAHTLVGEMPLVVTDPTSDVRFKNNVLVTGGLGIRFYAGAPLITSKEEAHLGALCVIDQKAKQDLSEEQKKLLNALAKLAVKCIEAPETA